MANGIWLCQNHAKLIDDDEIAFPATLLREWKDTAERMAYLEARGFAVRRAHPFRDLEKKAPALIAQMRQDLQRQPLVRQFVLLPNNRVSYAASYPQFCYFEEAHPYLSPLMTIMIHAGAIYDVRFNRVPRYNFTEEFVSFLIGDE
ncbi:hypothetical protein [Bradyrhizobium zhanjiangense]|uniref:Uncharacterized protein n=1 Tax=Bradyrhizobium zhanjiangense TaxID=1325107 RepID=A0A4Q0QDY7_9BRAD|nr:hypothetical protein [Bradyrhizobium zhanjiangense]RXG88729.1 hypothetical protein EAS61_29115 [Bradyrhizobium zhanjiangense]